MFETLEAGVLALQQHALNTETTEQNLYIPLQAITSSADNAERFDLQQSMLQFLNLRQYSGAHSNDAKVLLLLGDTGSGKSMFANSFYRYLWLHYQSREAIPLWLPLPELKQPFGEAITEVLLKFGFDETQVALLKKQYRFIFIADGYDELHAWQNIYMSNQIDEWQAQLIVTCRSQAIYSIRDYEKYFTPYQETQPLRHLLKKYFVAPFSESQIDSYLQKYKLHSYTSNDNDEETNSATITLAELQAVPGLAALITTPFLLHLAVTALPDILIQYRNAEISQQQKLTQATLYDVFIEHWFTRQIIKLKATGHIPENAELKPQLWQYCKTLAVKMHQLNVSHIQYSSVLRTTKGLFGKANATTTATPWTTFFTADKALLRSGCPLRQWGENTYGFIHASLIEYFATRAMFEESLTSTEIMAATNPTVIQPHSFQTAQAQDTSELNESIHYRLFTQESNAIQMLADRVVQYPRFKAKMFALIEKSKNNARFATGAANAITALNRAGVSFSGMDFKNINIPQAYLPKALMDYTDFTSADLTGINLTNTSLVQANFSQANLADIDFEAQAFIASGNSINCIAVSPDERLLAIANGNSVNILDRQTQNVLFTLQGHTRTVRSICYSADGNTLASGGDDQTICLWNTSTGQAIGNPLVSGMNVIAIAISPDGATLVSAHYDRAFFLAQCPHSPLRFWDIATQQSKENSLPDYLYKVHNLAYSPDGNFLAFSGNGTTVHVWATHSRKLIDLPFRVDHARTRVRADYVADCLAFSHDGNKLIASTPDRSIIIWEVATGEIIRTIDNAHNKAINCLAISPDGNTFATGSTDHNVCLWELATGKLIGEVLSGHTKAVTSLAFIDNGKMLLSASLDKTIRQRHVHSKQPVLNVSQQFHRGKVNRVASSADGRYLASCSDDNTILLWDSESGAPIGKPFVGHTLAVNCIAFSPDSQQLASGSTDCSVGLWDVNTQTLSQKLLINPSSGRFVKVDCVRFAPDGSKFAYVSSCPVSLDATIIIRDTVSREVLWTLVEHQSTLANISIAFSSDSLSLLSGGSYPSLLCWDLRTGKIATRIHETSQLITCVAWSPDGKVFAASCRNSLSLWNSLTHQRIAQRHAGHNQLITSVAFSPDSHFIATGSLDKTIILGETVNINRLFIGPLLGHSQGITSVTFVTNEKLLSGSQDYSLRLWQQKALTNGQKIWLSVWRSHPCVLQAFAANFTGTLNLSIENHALLKQVGIANSFQEYKDTLISTDDNNEFNQPSIPCASLLYAATHGAMSEVQRFLHDNANIDETDAEGYSALHHACNRGDEELVHLLIQHKANVNLAAQQGLTPLSLAAKQGLVKIAKLLIKAEADINAPSSSSPLFVSVENGHFDVVQLLIEANVNVNQANYNGKTPLYRAAQSGRCNIVQLLINANANVELGMGEETPLFVAVACNRLNVVELLINANANVDQANGGTYTPLLMAIQNDNIAIVRLLINAKADINKAKQDGTTPLLIAVDNNQVEIVRLLLAAKADIALADRNAITPLAKAFTKGNAEIIKLLRTAKTAARITQVPQAAIAASNTEWQPTERTETSPASSMKLFDRKPDSGQATPSFPNTKTSDVLVENEAETCNSTLAAVQQKKANP